MSFANRRTTWPKFLVYATYSAEGFKRLIKDKASGRKAAIEKVLAGVGAKLEATYLTLGNHDVELIIEERDNVSLTAIGLSTCLTGLARTSTTPLLTVEEADAAIKRSIQYHGPGR